MKTACIFDGIHAVWRKNDARKKESQKKMQETFKMDSKIRWILVVNLHTGRRAYEYDGCKEYHKIFSKKRAV